MNSEFKKLPGSRISLKITLSPTEFLAFVERALAKLVAEIEIPGYRKGKAPKELVRQRVGELALYQEAATEAAEKLFWQEVKKNDWEVITKPEITITQLAPDKPFEFEAVFTIVPQLTLPTNYQESLKALKHEKRAVVVQEEEIESSLLWLQRSRSSFEEVDRQAQEEDWLTIDLVMTHNHQPIEAGQQKDFRFLLKKNALIPGLFEQLLGHQKGEELRFSLTIPEDYWQKELAGKSLDFEVKIKKIEQEKLPELNDEFAQKVGRFNSLAELRESIAEGLRLEAEEKETQRFRLLLLEELRKLATFELPSVLIEREQEVMLEELKHSIKDNGLDWQEYLNHLGKSETELKQEFQPEAERRLAYALILDEVAKQQAIELTKEEVEQEANKYLAQFQTVAQAEKSIDVYKLIAYTKEKLRNEKTLQFLEQIVLSGN